MKKTFVVLYAILFVLSFGACKKNDTTLHANSALMFVNCCVGAPPLDASQNGTGLPNAQNLGYLSNSGYQSITSGTGINLAFVNSDGSVLTSQVTDRINTNSYYSVFASGSVTEPSILITSDNLLKPASGMAKIRFVNLSPDKLSLTCTSNGTQLLSGVDYQTVTAFYELPAATINLLLQDQNTPARKAQLGTAFSAEKIYTVVFAGTTPNYTLTVINNY
jgi:hypothetical protein